MIEFFETICKMSFVDRLEAGFVLAVVVYPPVFFTGMLWEAYKKEKQ